MVIAMAGSSKSLAGSVDMSAALLARRRAEDTSAEIRPLPGVSVDDVVTALSWRTFRWRGGQKHYSGTNDRRPSPGT